MSLSKKSSSADEMRQLEKALIESVISAPPEEIRAELEEAGEDFDVYVALANKMIAEAGEICARARLAEAKAAAAAFRAEVQKQSPIPFDRSKSKAKLETMRGRDADASMMLAARKGGGLSPHDEEALLRALADLEKLEGKGEQE